MLTPVTQRFAVSWPRSITYYEARWRILRRLDDEGLMYEFRTQNDIVFTRLGDANHLLSVGADGLAVSLLRPDADSSRVAAAVAIVWEEIAPAATLGGGCSFQWLEALDTDYEMAKRVMTNALIADDLPGVIDPDPAFLLVGGIDDPPARFALECGIVNPREVPGRLARELGQLSHLADPEVPSTLWAAETFPEVSFFCDSDWSGDSLVGRTAIGPGDVWNVWDTTRERAAGVVLAMMSRATGVTNA